MSDKGGTGGRDKRPPALFQALVELTIVGGAGLLAIFWIIPSQTATATAYGLSPSMMPITCATVIVALALLQCGVTLLRGRTASRAEDADAERPSVIHALLIVVAALIGAFVLANVSFVAGGVVLALLVSLAIGERRLVHNAVLGGMVAIVMLLVQFSGI